ncbi:MAG: DNA repair protein RecN [Bacteroidales bacterium]
MLRRLAIKNYALIDNLDINFPDGLVIITGETGAGKSILLGALSLLLGAKAEADVLKSSVENCIVEGEFDIANLPENILEILKNAGVESENNELILRRVISPLGRSRAFINDSPVTLNILIGISGRLIDIHAQHQHLLLTDENYQLSVLDYFSNATELLTKYKAVHLSLLSAKNTLAKLETEIDKSNKELDYKQYQFSKLEEAKLVDGELEELEAEQKQLANAEEIKNLTYEAVELFQPMGVSIVQNLKEASQLLRKCSNFVSEFENMAVRLESCRIECKDIESEIGNLSEKIIISPKRLELVEDRIGVIYSFFKKYNVNDVSSLLKIKDDLDRDIVGATNVSENRDKLIKTVAELEKERDSLANELSVKRESNISKLSNILEESIKDLEMPYARFKIELTKLSTYTATGNNVVEYLFSANGSAKLVSLQKVASGGELSRIMLCIKSLMAQYTGMPTMIFDEIDTGVSGSIADKMGNLIGSLGKHMQIFAITHLPQIATKGNTHLLVYKEFDKNNSARTLIKQLNNDERVMEIARMLSGAQLSKAAIENAKFLLKK